MRCVWLKRISGAASVQFRRWKYCGRVSSLDNDLPIVALVGRPNVGKSALFNRLIKEKGSMVKNTPESHVTRDYRYGIAKLGDLRFTVIDTSGLEPSPGQSIQSRATMLTKRLMDRVDLVLFMIDAREQVSIADEDVATWIRNLIKDESNLMLVANKCECLVLETGHRVEEVRDNLADAYRLGMGSPIAISAESGDGMIDLCEALLPRIYQPPETESDKTVISENPSIAEGQEAIDKTTSKHDIIKVAIMGLPNVGKSTLMNRLLKYERSLCGPEIGLTRDPVSEMLVFKNRKIELVDTAGWMKFFSYEKFSDADGKLAKESYNAAKRVLNLAHVIVVMIDVSLAQNKHDIFFRQELQLTCAVLKEKRVLIVVINKIDMLDEQMQQTVREQVVKRITGRFHDVENLVCIPISAQSGYGVDRLLPEIISKWDKWTNKVKTSMLNTWLTEVASVERLAKSSQAVMQRIKFLSQTRTRPPTFNIRVSGRTPITNLERQTFVNALRQAFDFKGVPLRVTVTYNVTWEQAKKMIERKRAALAT